MGVFPSYSSFEILVGHIAALEIFCKLRIHVFILMRKAKLRIRIHLHFHCGKSIGASRGNESSTSYSLFVGDPSCPFAGTDVSVSEFSVSSQIHMEFTWQTIWPAILDTERGSSRVPAEVAVPLICYFLPAVASTNFRVVCRQMSEGCNSRYPCLSPIEACG